MERYISITLLLFFGNLICIFLLWFLTNMGLISTGIAIILLLSIIISLLIRIIELLNKKEKNYR